MGLKGCFLFVELLPFGLELRLELFLLLFGLGSRSLAQAAFRANTGDIDIAELQLLSLGRS